MIRRPFALGRHLLQVIKRFGNHRVLIVGDAMLDGYLEGFTDRLCREAPVPVATVTHTNLAPGGAANTAANVASLGGQATFLSVVGQDSDGEQVLHALRNQGVRTEGVITHPTRRTLAKRRILASGQMIVRFDEGTTNPIDDPTEVALIARMREAWQASTAVIISDYGYGILTPAIIRAIGELQRAMPRVLTVDSKHLAKYNRTGATLVKPNYGEAIQLLGIPPLVATCERADQISAHADRFLALTGAQAVAVTLDSDGALIFEREHPAYRTYAEPKPDSHAAGAGDTFISALALSLAAGGDMPAAAEIASAAATRVVEREGTTPCSVKELSEFLSTDDKYLSDPQELARQVEEYRQQCRRVVFTNGCFDILHRGHIAYLNQAKALGDVLVLAVNSDESVRRLKGSGRPINSLEDRISVLAALSCVDHIVSFDSDTPEPLLRLIRPDVFVKGGDYTRETLPEARLVEELGGQVEILPYIQDRSTTSIIERIQKTYAGAFANG